MIQSTVAYLVTMLPCTASAVACVIVDHAENVTDDVVPSLSFGVNETFHQFMQQ